MSGCDDETAPPDRTRDMDAIYRREAPGLTRFFRRHVTARDDVPDLVQETFARLIGVASGPALTTPAAYLQRIARNLLIDRSRRTDARLTRFSRSIEDVPEIAVPPDQAFAIEADDLMRIYRRAVADLPEKTRCAFLLHRVEGLGYRDIGVRLGISVPTVQYHVARALVQIDKALEGG